MLIMSAAPGCWMWDTLSDIHHMDFNALLAQLRTEREMLEEAILAMERLARGSGKRRGRPPKRLTEPNAEGGQAAPPPPKTKRGISQAARKLTPEPHPHRCPPT